MPTYVYECSSCNDQFEIEQRITENALDTCRCGSTGTVKRIIQPVGIMFKGAGFHINDYKAAKPAEATTTEAKTETPSSTPAADCTGNPSTCACSTPEPKAS